MTGRYHRRPGFNETPVKNELFLIAGDSRNIFHLDQLAMAIWRALEEPASEDEMRALFQEVFPETPAATIELDLKAALSTLLNSELIELHD